MNRGTRVLCALLLTILSAGVAATLAGASSPGPASRPGRSTIPPYVGTVPSTALERTVKPSEHFDSAVDAVKSAFLADGASGAAKRVSALRMRLLQGMLTVIVESASGQKAAAQRALAAHGARVLATHGRLIRAAVPVGRLGELAGLPGIDFVRRPMTPQTCAISQGVAETGADIWQTAGWTGAGVKVGIIDAGFTGYPGKLGTELPAAADVVTWSQAGSPEDGGSDHGTAVAEVVHDVAPGAKLYLARANDEVDIGNAKDWMVGQGVKVINMSLCWPAWGLGDGTGDVNTYVTSAVNQGVFWANSAGNDRLGHWRGNFVDGNSNNWLDWGTANGQVWEFNTFTCSEGTDIMGVLRWQDSWGGATQDYDFYLYRWAAPSGPWVEVEHSANVQSGAAWHKPYEQILVTAPATAYYSWRVKRQSATKTAVDFDLNMKNLRLDDPTNSAPHWFDHVRSVVPPADNLSFGFMAAAAVGRAPGFAQEWYSSEGPTRDGRSGPKIAGPANVSNSVYVSFAGTSAASPHVAGVAALIKQSSPSATPVNIEAYLRGNAVDLGAAGLDWIFGFGRLHLGTPPPRAISITSPTAASSWPSGSTQTVTWTINPAVSTGEFRVWLVSAAGGWYINKQVLPVAGKTSYSSAITASVPAAAGYKAYVYWRPAVGTGTWTATARSAGFTVTPKITLSAPLAGASWPVASTQTVSWTLNSAVSTGELRVWLVSASGGWYVNKQVLPVAGKTSYSTSLPVSVPAGAGYRVCVGWRADTALWKFPAQGYSAGFTVTP